MTAEDDPVDRLRPSPEDRSVGELLRFGVMNLDKPPGPSAHQVTGWVRDMIAQTLEAREQAPIDGAAHAGTLDPKVTGCLPILTGTATRAARVFRRSQKEYIAVLELHARVPADFEDVVEEFESELYQKPPRKSAVVRKLRTRQIHQLDILEQERRQALLRIRCEAGTYVRKLCHDLGLALGTGAHMGHLRRSGTGRFDDTDLITLQDLSDALAWADDGDESVLRDVVVPAERALEPLPSVTIASNAARQVAEGAPVYAPGVIDVEGVPDKSVRDDGDEAGGQTDEGPLVACYTPNGAAVALGQYVGDADADRGTVVSLERVLV